MKTIGEFARKPELIKIELDSEDIQHEYGDTVVFYMKDFVDINTYFEFFRGQAEQKEMGHILQTLVLNEEGQPMLKEGEELPASLALAALGRINEKLGKSETRP